MYPHVSRARACAPVSVRVRAFPIHSELFLQHPQSHGRCDCMPCTYLPEAVPQHRRLSSHLPSAALLRLCIHHAYSVQIHIPLVSIFLLINILAHCRRRRSRRRRGGASRWAHRRGSTTSAPTRKHKFSRRRQNRDAERRQTLLRVCCFSCLYNLASRVRIIFLS